MPDRPTYRLQTGFSMLGQFRQIRTQFAWKRWLAGASMLALVVWLVFFDSHSIERRVRWYRESERLEAENQRIEKEIADLKVKLKDVRSEEVVEEIAREQYGMRRPGETVYRIDEAP